VTAAIAAINAQLRADEHQLRRKTQGDTLQRLLKIIEREKKRDAVTLPLPPGGRGALLVVAFISDTRLRRCHARTG
jgi:hypothetical protein